MGCCQIDSDESCRSAPGQGMHSAEAAAAGLRLHPCQAPCGTAGPGANTHKVLGLQGPEFLGLPQDPGDTATALSAWMQQLGMSPRHSRLVVKPAVGMAALGVAAVRGAEAALAAAERLCREVSTCTPLHKQGKPSDVMLMSLHLAIGLVADGLLAGAMVCIL